MLTHPILFTGFIFHQLYLLEVKGWSLGLWGQLFTVYAFSGIIAQFIAGFAVDKLSAFRVVPVAAISLVIGLTVLGFSSQTYAAWVFMIFLGIATGVQSTVSAPFWVEMYGSRHIGSIKSVTAFSVVASTAVSPAAMGWLIDAGVEMNTIAHGSVLFIILALASAAIALNKHKNRNSLPV